MDKKKHVDESWKDQATEEKDKLSDGVVQQTEAPKPSETPAGDAEQAHEVEINFLNYVTSLGFQAMIFMGEIPNPVTNQVEKNLAQAKFLIDTLNMLKEKTAGNLTDQEKNLLESSIYELQMRYVQLIQQEGSSDTEQAQ